MHASVHAFLNGIIDYAGMFPPAKLPLAEALRRYSDYKNASPYGWMLGRFVCPTNRLPELLPLAKANENGARLQMTALGPQGATVADFFLQLETSIEAILEFRRDWGAEKVVDTIEIPLPHQHGIAAFLGKVEGLLEQAELRGFLEVPMSATWQKDVAEFATRIPPGHSLGLKLRCGGVTAAAFPTNEQVAFFIARCRDLAIPWKATAGLHHPGRHWDEAMQVWHHGFLNVFGAGLLATANSLTDPELIEILADRDGRYFRFESDRFAWKDWTCTTAQILEFRQRGPTSFGSCSFEEPCADLLAMGLIEVA